MTRLSTGALGALVVCAGALSAEKPSTKPLRSEITALRKQEKAIVAEIKAQYDVVIHRDRVEESVLFQERAALAAQEKQVLATAPKADHAAIRARYKELRDVLRTDYKIDAAAILHLHEMETAQVKQVEAIYRAQISQLEAEIALMHGAAKPKK